MIESFARYLRAQKRVSAATAGAYRSDLLAFEAYLSQCAEETSVPRGLDRAERADIERYLRSMSRAGRSASSVCRATTSIRRFYQFLNESGVRTDNPARDVCHPVVEKRSPEILSRMEMRAVFDAVDSGDACGKRDFAILQTLYHTGLKISEILELRIGDVNIAMSYLRVGVSPRSGARIIKMSKSLRDAIENYVASARPALVRRDTDYLFLNYLGGPITRQGFWKNFKSIVERAGLDPGITFARIKKSFEFHSCGIDRIDPEN